MPDWKMGTVAVTARRTKTQYWQELERTINIVAILTRCIQQCSWQGCLFDIYLTIQWIDMVDPIHLIVEP